MTLNDGFERTVSDWLDEQAGHGMPGYLDEVLARTTRTRQRPAWSSLERWLPVDLTTNLRFAARPTLGKALLLGAVLVALIGLALIAVGSRVQRVPPPFGLAANGQIAYWADGDILVADPDGTHAHAVISGPSDDFAAGYTRDGTQLMFLRTVSPHEATLMIAAPDGSGVRSLLKEPLTDATWFDWSPDSRSLAVVHKANGVRVLSIVDIEHGTMRTLDVNGLAVDYWVAWLPGTTSELLFGSRSGSGDSERAGHLLDPGRWEWPDTRRAVRDGPRRVQGRRSRARRPNPHVLALGVGDAARAHPSARHRHQMWIRELRFDPSDLRRSGSAALARRLPGPPGPQRHGNRGRS